MAKFGIDSNMVFDKDDKSVAARLSDHDTQMAESAKNLSGRGINVLHPPNDSGLLACKMDGITNDTTAFQAIINYASNNQYFVYIPSAKNSLILTSTIIIPNGLTIRGDNYYYTNVGAGTSVIDSTANPVFQPVGYNGTNVNIAFHLFNIRIICHVTNNAFLGFAFQYSIHEGFQVINSNIVYNNCSFNQLSDVRHSQFYQINTSFLVGQVVDSYIHHNYINGSTANNTTIAFNMAYPATCWIHHNYIDFFDQVFIFDSSGGNQWTISDNIIDYCRVGITGHVTNGIISANKFNMCTTSSSSHWITPNANMSNSWFAMGNSAYWTNVRIVNNIGINTDILINFYQMGSHSSIYTSGNSCTGTLISYLSSADPNNSAANTNIYFQELMYKSYTSLPDPRIFVNANVVVSFVNQIINYNGKYLYNDGLGSWKDFMGNVVTS